MKDIQVFDGLMTIDEIICLDEWLATLPYTYTERSNLAGYLHWAAELPTVKDPKSMGLSIINQTIDYAFRSYKEKDLSKLKIERMYCNAHNSNDIPLIHKDSWQSGNYTMLIYGNRKWDPKWAGETAFFDEDSREIIKSVLPKPGRVVIFESDIPHAARVPTREFPGLRFTIAIKLVS